MQHHSPKANLWSKMRSSTKQLSSSLANLSLRTEHDGDTEDTTLIHKALVNHYIKTNQPFPEWLGVSASQQQQLQQDQHHQQQQQNDQFRKTQSAPSTATTRTSSSTGSVADKYRRQPASSSFKDIYSRGATTGAPQQQQQQHSQQQPYQQQQYQQHSAPVGGTRPVWGQTTENAQALQGSNQDARSAMRDRLKRNNYRSNFGV